ncbi:virulence-associated E family protein [Microcoleus sp. bin38.metabat.b11b12b14.051]|uniref:virulence-associated E family protein n=1 Tax=Microcoleus sp. bin38.metabat.b11b12b14.051 TaxID=2742709 RepID=UPI0025E52058|nr:virulence-associated E family protein [Microcoleus sp. bin38.metabat.b11b12b14.051]
MSIKIVNTAHVVDREQTTTHLRYLGYNRSEGVFLRFFYHSLDPRKDADKGRKLSNLDWNAIEKHQDDGRGVYVVVNGAGGGHTDGDIKQCCAVFCEWDDISLAEQSLKWEEIGFVEPTFTVYSGDKSMQPYWVFDEPIAVEQWRELQTLLITAMGADKSNKNPSRVFRLAGGWHVKPGREPVKSEIVQDSRIRYSYGELCDRLINLVSPAQPEIPPTEPETKKEPAWKKVVLPVPIAVPLEIGLSRKSRDALSGVQTLRNTTMAALARDLLGTATEFDRAGQITNDAAYTLFTDACRRCASGGGWGEKEWEQIWRSASSKSQVSSISHNLSPEALENCIKAWYWKQTNPVSKSQNQTKPPETEKSVSADNRILESDDKLIQDYNKVVKVFGSRIRLNKLSKRIEVDGKPVSLDRAKLQLAVRHGLLLKSGREDIQDIIAEVAEQNEYSPVAEYLRSLPFCMDTSILDRISETYFGVSGDIYTTFIRKTLIAAVNRALVPGCKVDTALILHGKQGYKKSSFFNILAGEYFDDSMGAASEKDERLKLHRSWFIEWSELERIFGKKDASAAKAFVTSKTDMIRPPYGRDIQDLPRPSIIVATTNQDEFLVDPTGARRFWVIPVSKKIDTSRLAEERDAIWGAAVAAYYAGELCYLNDDQELVAEAIAAEFRSSDPWEESISSFIENREWIRTSDILDHLRIDLDRQDRSHQMRVASILKVMGWSKNIRAMGEKRIRVWVPDCPDLPQNVSDLPQNTEVDHKVDHPNNPAISTLQPLPFPPDLPDLPKSKEKDFLLSQDMAETQKTTLGFLPTQISLGKKVDQVDQVDQNQSGKGIEETPPQDNEVVQGGSEVDQVEIEAELVEFIRSAIHESDTETAKAIQSTLREVCASGNADRARVWAALADGEQEAFKALLVGESELSNTAGITEEEAQTMRSIAEIWWDVYFPNTQSLVTQLFGWNEPGQKHGAEAVLLWLQGESEVVRDRIGELIKIKLQENEPTKTDL